MLGSNETINNACNERNYTFGVGDESRNTELKMLNIEEKEIAILLTQKNGMLNIFFYS